MQYMKAKQLATGMLVAVLLLSGLVIFPAATVQAASSSAPISLNVVDSTNAPVAGATATLTETHTSKMYSTTTDAGGLATFSPLPGYYILRLSKSGFYDLEHSTVVKYDGINPVQLGLVQITSLPTTTGTLTITVNSGLTVTLKTIDLNSPTGMEKVYTFTTSTVLTVHTSTYRLVTSANGYETDVQDKTVTSGGNVNVPITMNAAKKVNGYVYKSGAPPTGMTAVLVSSNLALPVQKRILTGRLSSNYFEFDAFTDANPFYLMVDAVDSQASMISITVVGSQSLTVNLTAQNVQTVSNGMVFAGSDWNNFNLYNNITKDFDASWPNIAYSYVPNLRMQIDFAFGDGNGVVSGTEYTAFLNRVKALGPVNVTSDFMVRVNSTKYTVLTDFTSASFTALSGSTVTSTAQYTGAFVTPYRSQSTIVNGGSNYNVIAFANYDTNSIDNKVFLTWPKGNEMTSNSTSTGNAKVTGYLTVNIDPALKTTGTVEQVTMTVQKSLAPSATAGVGLPSDYAYAVTSGTSVLHYIVNSQKAIVFTANGSSDPNSNPLKFTWNFGNGVTQGPITSSWTTNTYNAAAYNLTVSLTVTDVAGLTAVKSFYVKSDGINPTPDFTVKNHTLSAQTPNLVVKQNEALVFNGATSFDHIASTSSSDVGIIKAWQYIWGDGNKTTVGIGENQNVTKTYARAGTFTMLLNTTDVAGRVSTKSVVVLVKDAVAPNVVFNVYLNGVLLKGTAQENQTLLFSANGTTDNNDSFSELSFAWTFGDGDTANGPVVNHKYENIKTFTVKLEVTDLAGNKANATKSLVITSQPRPDLRIVSVKADPNPMTEGSTGKFIVNVTNVGNANAVLASVTVSILNSDGSKSTIGTSNEMTNRPGNDTLMPGKYGLFEVSWTPSGKGNYTIVAVASATDEINKADNTYTTAVTVNEATWKAIALYGGIFAVIVVIIVLYYYRKRLPKLGGGKKEKAPTKEESKKQTEEKKSKK
jgi:hypothetical protein